MGQTLRVACASVLFFSFIYLYMLMVGYVDFRLKIDLVMHSLFIKHLTVNIVRKLNCGKLNLRYYKASGIYIAKNKPFKIKLRKVNKNDK